MMDAHNTQLNFTSGMSSATNSGMPNYPRPLTDTRMPAYTRPLSDTEMYQQNQLQFNLNIASNPSKLAAQFRRPGPLVIEKVGGVGPSAEDTIPEVSPVKFSVVSENRLSLAIQLAKRDLKNKLRENEQKQKMEALEAAEANTQKGKKRTKKSHTVKGKPKKSSQESRLIVARQLPMRERTGKERALQSAHTQTTKEKPRHHLHHRGQDASRHGLVLHLTSSTQDANVVHRSQETDDTPTPSMEVRVAESPVSQQAREIKRLRHELKQYISKIEQLSKQASQNIPREVRTKSAEYEEADAEEVKRKAAKKAEQASRSARLLYSLQQQVREIQEELDKLGPGQIRHTKKSRAMNRLAAAHRGAVRALQAFVNHLPEQADAGEGLPPLYQELARLIRQLSMCCAQLDIEESGVPDGVLNIIEQAKDLGSALEKQFQSPPQPSRSVSDQTSPRRRLAFELPPEATVHVKSLPGQRPHAQSGQARGTFSDKRVFGTSPSKDVPVRDTDVYLSTSPIMHRRPQSDGRPGGRDPPMYRATPGSPERTAIMRSGLHALLRAEANQPSPQPITNPVQTDVGKVRSSQPIRTQNRQPPTNKRASSKRPPLSSRSLILPAKLKADRERFQRRRAVLKDAHFTLATKSSIAKHQQIKADAKNVDEESQRPAPAPTPAWTPPGTPRSFHKVSTLLKESEEDDQEDVSTPRSQNQRSKAVHFKESERSQEDAGMRRHGLDVAVARKEIARQAWLDTEVARRLYELDELRKAELEQMHKLREDIGQPTQFIDEAKRAIKERLQPLTSNAQELSKGHSRNTQQELSKGRSRNTQMSEQSVSHQLSKRALDKACNQGDLLSDVILEDILEDTAREMQRIEHRTDIETQAREMQDSPAIEGLLHTLDIMQMEEEQIRRRWKKVSYADSEPDIGGSRLANSKYMEGADRVARDSWMTGTPLEGALLERLSGEAPQQHISMVYTNISHNVMESSTDRDTASAHSIAREPNSRLAHPTRKQAKIRSSTHFDKSKMRLPSENATGGRYFYAGNTENTYLQGITGISDRTLKRPKYTLFVPTESKKRIEQYRERFDRHLKRMSHQTIGTFDPWLLCDELADEILEGILDQVTAEVSDTMASCVDDLYKIEFDMT